MCKYIYYLIYQSVHILYIYISRAVFSVSLFVFILYYYHRLSNFMYVYSCLFLYCLVIVISRSIVVVICSLLLLVA